LGTPPLFEMVESNSLNLTLKDKIVNNLS